MSGSINKVVLLGRLGKDPEVRVMNNGNKVVSFSIATEETWRDKATGERKSKTEWTNIVIFNEHLGKVAESYLKKGVRVYLEGKLQTRKWQDANGTERYSTEVVLQQYLGELCLLDPIDRPATGQGGTASGREGEGSYTPTGARQTPAGGAANGRSYDLEDDIPF
jgi:single-strand DNA-binding protein